MSDYDEENGAPPKREPLARLLAHLEAVQGGTATPQAVLESFRPDLEDGYCVFNLYEQFREAFRYQPGRQEALAPILRLTRKALDYRHDDALVLFRDPDWTELVGMRGPVDAAALATCRFCGTTRVSFFLGGFTDEFDAVCGSCGNALFQSIYDDRPLPPCDCGGTYHRTSTCPTCGSADADSQQRSSYEYFATHSWKRRS